MINLYERMSLECYGEVAAEFKGERRQSALQEILGRHKVNAPEMLAIFLSIIAKGIAFETVNKEAKPPKWYWVEKAGHYLSAKEYEETAAAYASNHFDTKKKATA
jgi:hypothetical protein